MPETLKVKDYSNIYWLIVPFCMFPLVFMGIASIVSNNYLIAFIVTFIIYGTYLTLFIRNLIKNENVYAIVANETEVSFIKQGTFKWNEISSIKTYTKIVSGGRSRYEEKYIQVNLMNESNFSIEVSSFDYNYKEIAEKLRKLGKIN